MGHRFSIPDGKLFQGDRGNAISFFISDERTKIAATFGAEISPNKWNQASENRSEKIGLRVERAAQWLIFFQMKFAPIVKQLLKGLEKF